MADDKVIEGEFQVVGEKPKREPVIGSLWGLLWIAFFVALNFAVRAWWGFAYGWGMKHIHLQLSELLRWH